MSPESLLGMEEGSRLGSINKILALSGRCVEAAALSLSPDVVDDALREQSADEGRGGRDQQVTGQGTQDEAAAGRQEGTGKGGSQVNREGRRETEP